MLALPKQMPFLQFLMKIIFQNSKHLLGAILAPKKDIVSTVVGFTKTKHCSWYLPGNFWFFQSGCSLEDPDVNSEPSQTFKMELFAETVNNF